MLAVLIPFLFLLLSTYLITKKISPRWCEWSHWKEYTAENPVKAFWMKLVLVTHSSLIVYLAIIRGVVPSVPQPKNVVVQTIALQQKEVSQPKAHELPVAKLEPKPELKPKPKPKPEPELKPKQVAKKPEEKKKTAPAPPKPVVKKENKKKLELLEKARKELAAINEPKEPIAQRSEPVKKKHGAQVQSQQVAPERSYEDELIKRLQTQLRLPDYGDVRVNVKLDRQGKIVNLEIIGTESAVNAAYIRDILPTLKLADFGELFPGKSTQTFTLSLTNEF